MAIGTSAAARAGASQYAVITEMWLLQTGVIVLRAAVRRWLRASSGRSTRSACAESRSSELLARARDKSAAQDLSSMCGSPSPDKAVRVAWLLCGLLAWVATHPLHCGLCDELYSADSSSLQAAAAHSVPVAHDECNGVCSCCFFHVLPPVTPVLYPANTVATAIWIAPSSPVLAPHGSIFRPPRA